MLGVVAGPVLEVPDYGIKFPKQFVHILVLHPVVLDVLLVEFEALFRHVLHKEVL